MTGGGVTNATSFCVLNIAHAEQTPSNIWAGNKRPAHTFCHVLVVQLTVTNYKHPKIILLQFQ